MKKIVEITTLCLAMMLCGLIQSCTDATVGNEEINTEGTQLHVKVNFGTLTRVGELPNTEAINDPGTNGLQNVGLYVYYASDYTGNDLTKPYIRNMECEIVDGQLVPVLAEGENAANKDIYIYDYMTLVAFYPYNAEMNDPDNYFSVRADEEKYPITRADYSEQTYIPYRGQVTVNPTTAFYIELELFPKHTFKLEIILVSEDGSDFAADADVKLLPAIDPVDNEDLETAGKREKWFDFMTDQPDTGGGMNVRRYTAYFWQDETLSTVIEQNEVLYDDGSFSLLATERIIPREQRVYRYGYNFTTGESFIPTSSTLINDAQSLQNSGGSYRGVYQVCDIDMAEFGNFTPLTMFSSTYDGGGHMISNLTINSSDYKAGLFGQIQGNSALKNVNLIDPVITLNTSVDSCYAGALCARLNNRLDEAALQDIIDNLLLPENLSEVVKEALIQDLLADAYNTYSQIIACRVENARITVNGVNPHVGTICGMNGDRETIYTFKGAIWDTYSLGGSLVVNANTPENNANAFVGGFCGLNEFFIGRSYTTIEADNIIAQHLVTVTDDEGVETQVPEDYWQGFTNQGTLYTTAEGATVDDCYAVAPDTNSNVSIMPGAWPSGWVSYSGVWPINTSTWTNYSGNKFWYDLGSAATVYPTLHWQRWTIDY